MLVFVFGQIVFSNKELLFLLHFIGKDYLPPFHKGVEHSPLFNSKAVGRNMLDFKLGCLP